MRRRRLFYGLIVPAIWILLGISTFYAWNRINSGTKQMVLELDSGYVYDEGMREVLLRQKEEGNAFVLWKEERGISVTNPEFVRTFQFDTIALAGESQILFPYGNILETGEEGYCLLGKQVAEKLFGTTKVSGKKVLIHGKVFQVAGVQFEKPDMVVYELPAKEVENIEYAAFTYENRKEQYLKMRSLEYYFAFGTGIL